MSLARCLIVIYDTAPGWPAQMAIRSFKKGDPKVTGDSPKKTYQQKRVVFLYRIFFGDRIPRKKMDPFSEDPLVFVSVGAGLMTTELSHCGSIRAIASS